MVRVNCAQRITLAGALVAFALGCGTDTRDTTPIVDTSPADDAEVITESPAWSATATVADIVGDPQAHIGQEVTIVADVDEVFGPRAFTLDEDAPLAGGLDNDLLVLGDTTALPEALDDQWMDDAVRVTGEVAYLTVEEIEARVGWQLDQALTDELEGRQAVLIATSVEHRMPSRAE
jgi:hypothetical protein